MAGHRAITRGFVNDGLPVGNFRGFVSAVRKEKEEPNPSGPCLVGKMEGPYSAHVIHNLGFRFCLFDAVGTAHANCLQHCQFLVDLSSGDFKDSDFPRVARGTSAIMTQPWGHLTESPGCSSPPPPPPKKKKAFG